MAKFELLKNRLSGPVFSIITPFKENEDIDYNCLEKYISLIFESGGKSFFVMGYNSRFSQLASKEIKQLNEFVTKTVKSLNSDNLVIVADPLHCSTIASADFCKHAEQIGADMISLIFREKFYSNEQVLKHYKFCADASSIGILIHEMPFTSGYGGHQMHWPIDLLDQLADIENIVAIKEDAKDDEYSQEVINLIKERVRIVISGGGKRQWLKFAEAGCQSWLNGIGVFHPKLATSFWTSYQNGNMPHCLEIIEKVEVPFFEKCVSKYGWHLAAKAALEARGIMSRRERMPLLSLDEQEYQHVVKVIKSLPIDEVC